MEQLTTPATIGSTTPTLVSEEERNYAAILHVATLVAAVFTAGFLDILVPVGAYILLGEKGDFFRKHVKEQLNFQLTIYVIGALSIAGIVMTLGLGVLVALPLWGALWLGDIVFSIVAAMKARDGEDFSFPFAIRFLK